MLKAFFKLSLRDRIVLMAAGILFVICFSFCFYLLMTKSALTKEKFPESTLSKDSSVQSYHHYDYSELDTAVQFPGTDYVIHLKGKEAYTAKEGAAFMDEDGVFYITALCKKTADSVETVGNILPELFMQNGSFVLNERDTGYLNTLHLDYVTGIFETSGSTLYVVLYRFYTDEGDMDILFGAANTTGENLRGLKNDADHMLHTLLMVKPREDEAQEENEMEDTDMESENVQTELPAVSVPIYDPTKPCEINISMETGDELEGKEAAFYVEYSVYDTVSKKATLEAPSGKIYAPSFNNEDKSGYVYFLIEDTEKGTWNLHLEGEAPYGTFIYDVTSKEQFKEVIAPDFENAYPHDGEED